VPVDPVALADRLRTAAQEMSEENFHDWAFLTDLAADALVAKKRQPDRIAKDAAIAAVTDFERRLPSMLSSIQSRKM